MASISSSKSFEGWMNKQGDNLMKNWKRRWFVLDPSSSVLDYYTDETKKTKKGGPLDLIDSQVRLAGNSDFQRSNCFVLQTQSSDRSYVLQADSESERRKWMDVLTQAASVNPPQIEETAPGLDRSSSKSFPNKARNMLWGGAKETGTSPATTEHPQDDLPSPETFGNETSAPTSSSVSSSSDTSAKILDKLGENKIILEKFREQPKAYQTLGVFTQDGPQLNSSAQSLELWEIATATSPVATSTIIHAGFLVKMGSLNIRSYKTRWFLLTNTGLMFYYKNADDLEAVGVIPLIHGAFIQEEPEITYENMYCFSVSPLPASSSARAASTPSLSILSSVSPSQQQQINIAKQQQQSISQATLSKKTRKWILFADSAESRQLWMNACQKSIKEATVAALQQQQQQEQQGEPKPSEYMNQPVPTFTMPFLSSSSSSKKLYTYTHIRNKQGWLKKIGHFRKNWKKRFFVLSGTFLHYFVREHDATLQAKQSGILPLGNIDLQGCVVELVVKSTNTNNNTADCICYSITLVPADGKRKYVFVAETRTDAEEWVKEIEAANKTTKSSQQQQSTTTTTGTTATTIIKSASSSPAAISRVISTNNNSNNNNNCNAPTSTNAATTTSNNNSTSSSTNSSTYQSTNSNNNLSDDEADDDSEEEEEERERAHAASICLDDDFDEDEIVESWDMKSAAALNNLRNNGLSNVNTGNANREEELHPDDVYSSEYFKVRAVKEGFMHKLGEQVKNFKRRYFILLEGKLSYYADKPTAKTERKLLKGCIPIFGSEVSKEIGPSVASSVFHSNAFSGGVAPSFARQISNKIMTGAVSSSSAQTATSSPPSSTTSFSDRSLFIKIKPSQSSRTYVLRCASERLGDVWFKAIKKEATEVQPLVNPLSTHEGYLYKWTPITTSFASNLVSPSSTSASFFNPSNPATSSPSFAAEIPHTWQRQFFQVLNNYVLVCFPSHLQTTKSVKEDSYISLTDAKIRILPNDTFVERPYCFVIQALSKTTTTTTTTSSSSTTTSSTGTTTTYMDHNNNHNNNNNNSIVVSDFEEIERQFILSSENKTEMETWLEKLTRM